MIRLLIYSFLSLSLISAQVLQVYAQVQVENKQKTGEVEWGSSESGIVGGVVLESGTSIRLAQVNVRNLQRRITVTTDNLGIFRLQAQVGDSLVFSKLGYENYSTVLQTMSDILIDLKPSTIRIDAVTVEGRSREQELREGVESYQRHGVYSGGKPAPLAYIFSPLTSLYERFSRKGRQARRFRNYMENEMEAIQVDRIFSRYRIVELTGLSGEDLNNFAFLYRPTFQKAQYWNEYDVTNYILTSFKQFEVDGRPAPQKLPKLEIPPQKK